jgi:hypothetical protein
MKTILLSAAIALLMLYLARFSGLDAWLAQAH